MILSTLSKPVRWCFRVLMIATLSVAFVLLKVEIAQPVVSVIYTVNGIMFSVAMSQLVSFSFTEIENDKFVRDQRSQLLYLRTVFIVLFSLSTIAFVVSDIVDNGKYINPICFSVLIFSLVYNVVNFCSMVKTKDAIEDKIRAARKRG